MKIVDMTATADDNILEEEQKDLEYRKEQLKRLQEEVADIEDMNTGINIMDLGLNEFRLDLLEYVKDFSLYEEVTVNGQRFVLIHTISENISNLYDLEDADLSEPGELLISRPDFEEGLEGDDIFIIGHTPTCLFGKKDSHIYRNGKLIDIDCGCVMGGNLSALCLETMEEFYVAGKARKET